MVLSNSSKAPEVGLLQVLKSFYFGLSNVIAPMNYFFIKATYLYV